jgi:hypothetical protein
MSKFNKETELYPDLVRVKRVHGKVDQSCDLYVSKECTAGGWALPQSKWYKRSMANDPDEYLQYIKSNDELFGNVYELVGQTLGCWCTGKKAESCHATILIEQTKTFLTDYFDRIKKQNRDLELTSRKRIDNEGPRMKIVPQQTYRLKIRNIPKKYNLRVIKRTRTRSRSPSPPPLIPEKTVVKKIRLSQEKPPPNTIQWNGKKREWVLPEGYELTEDYLIPFDAKITFGGSCAVHFNLKKGSQLAKDGRIPIQSLITKPIEIKIPSPPKKVMPDFEHDYTIITNKTPAITQSAIGDLFTGKRDEWDPFVCRVEARLFNKKTNRFMLKLFDGVAMYKVQLGSQLFDMVEEKFVDQGDLIQVIDYASTKINARKRVVIFYNIKKFVVK